MNNPTGLNHLDMLTMTGLLSAPSNRKTMRSSGARIQTNAKKVNRSERRKKSRSARKSRARNRS